MAVDIQTAGEATITKQAEAGLADVVSPTPAELARIVETAAASNEWIQWVRLRADRRWYERIYHSPDYGLWVISWLPGQSTGFSRPRCIFGCLHRGDRISRGASLRRADIPGGTGRTPLLRSRLCT
jgi:hypothetical protein